MDNPRPHPILMVEDSDDDTDISRRGLRTHNLWNELVRVGTGEEALDYLRGAGKYAGRDTAIQPCLILLDLCLPKMPGLDVLRRVRADERAQALSVVVFTGSEREEDYDRARALGVTSYIRKPTDITKFIKAVAQIGLRWAVYR